MTGSADHASDHRSAPIEGYALIGDMHSAALVSRSGSIDWLCLPRFDSAACFAALVGRPENGCWTLGPTDSTRSTVRRYRADTLVLESEHRTDSGVVRVLDFMPPRDRRVDVVRIVEGLEGTVAITSALSPRFDFGRLVPWIDVVGPTTALAAGGPNALRVDATVPLVADRSTIRADFEVAAGQRVGLTVAWHPSHEPPPDPLDPFVALEATSRWWRRWMDGCDYAGPASDLVRRSLITLKAMTYAPTGGIVAAPTTSLPEIIGGVRNWDYRYCWLRDATFTLQALLIGGFTSEAAAFRDWLLRAIAGEPGETQIMYAVDGERLLYEVELDWLQGFADSVPVRIGNAASDQFQLDVYGEIMDAMHQARRLGIDHDQRAWQLQLSLMEFLEAHWQDDDAGIWESRSAPRAYTHSKVMAWVAADRAVKAIEQFGLSGDAERWRRLREAIHLDVCTNGWNVELGSFTRAYGSTDLDASLLLLPLVGFLPPDDPRIEATVEAVRRELERDGFLLRYDSAKSDDGLPEGEGVFLACTFWLADALALMGRRDEAQRVFARAAGVANDVGLLAEEYDHRSDRMLGNFPQALSHIALVTTARNLVENVAQSATRRAR